LVLRPANASKKIIAKLCPDRFVEIMGFGSQIDFVSTHRSRHVVAALSRNIVEACTLVNLTTLCRTRVFDLYASPQRTLRNVMNNGLDVSRIECVCVASGRDNVRDLTRASFVEKANQEGLRTICATDRLHALDTVAARWSPGDMVTLTDCVGKLDQMQLERIHGLLQRGAVVVATRMTIDEDRLDDAGVQLKIETKGDNPKVRYTFAGRTEVDTYYTRFTCPSFALQFSVVDAIGTHELVQIHAIEREMPGPVVAAAIRGQSSRAVVAQAQRAARLTEQDVVDRIVTARAADEVVARERDNAQTARGSDIWTRTTLAHSVRCAVVSARRLLSIMVVSMVLGWVT
jgi:hypothetical protein